MKTYQLIQVGRKKVFTFKYYEEHGQTLNDAKKLFNVIIEEIKATEETGLKPWTQDLYIIDDDGNIITEYHQ